MLCPDDPFHLGPTLAGTTSLPLFGTTPLLSPDTCLLIAPKGLLNNSDLGPTFTGGSPSLTPGVLSMRPEFYGDDASLSLTSGISELSETLVEPIDWSNFDNLSSYQTEPSSLSTTNSPWPVEFNTATSFNSQSAQSLSTFPLEQSAEAFSQLAVPSLQPTQYHASTSLPLNTSRLRIERVTPWFACSQCPETFSRTQDLRYVEFSYIMQSTTITCAHS